jgi:hypothetical protein
VAVLALIFYAYLGAVVSPEENLEDLPGGQARRPRRREVLGYLILLLRDVFARRERKEAGKVAETAG